MGRAEHLLEAGEGVALGMAPGHRPGGEVHRHRRVRPRVGHPVVAAAPVEGVRPRTAFERVVAPAPDQAVGPATAPQTVVPAPAEETLVPVTPLEPDGRRRRGRRRRRRLDGVRGIIGESHEVSPAQGRRSNPHDVDHPPLVRRQIEPHAAGERRRRAEDRVQLRGRQLEAREIDPVLPVGEIGDGVGAVSAREDEDVAARPAGQGVRPGAAFERVGAAAAVEGIRPRPAVEHVVAVTAGQGVGVARPHDPLEVALEALHRVGIGQGVARGIAARDRPGGEVHRHPRSRHRGLRVRPRVGQPVRPGAAAQEVAPLAPRGCCRRSHRSGCRRSACPGPPRSR